MTHPTTLQANHLLKGRIFINGKEARVLFDEGMKGGNLISATFVTTNSIPGTLMKESIKIRMGMNGSLSGSHKESTVHLTVGKMQTRRNPMLVRNLANYNALIGIPFLNPKKP